MKDKKLFKICLVIALLTLFIVAQPIFKYYNKRPIDVPLVSYEITKLTNNTMAPPKDVRVLTGSQLETLYNSGYNVAAYSPTKEEERKNYTYIYIGEYEGTSIYSVRDRR